MTLPLLNLTLTLFPYYLNSFTPSFNNNSTL
jgi:hypothetical protein